MTNRSAQCSILGLHGAGEELKLIEGVLHIHVEFVFGDNVAVER